MIEINMLFREDFKKLVSKTTYEGDLNLTRALFLKNDKTINLNLDAEQWVAMYVLGTDSLITEISKTLCHECVHYIINEYGIEGSDYYEEYLCKTLAGQLEE